MFRIRQFNAPSAELGKAAEILPWILNTGAPISMGRQRHTVSVWVSNPEMLRVKTPPCPSISLSRSALSIRGRVALQAEKRVSDEVALQTARGAIRALRWAGALQRDTRPGVAPHRDCLLNRAKALTCRKRALRPSQSVPVTPRGFFVCPQAAPLS